MNKIYQNPDSPRLVWDNGNPILTDAEMRRWIGVAGETYVGAPPIEPIATGLSKPEEVIACFRLAFPLEEFYGIGPDFDPPFKPVDETDEIVQ